MAYETVDCVDAGSEYCPCYLAETNNCLICSQLQGQPFCDCINWKGVCILQEYAWNQNRIKAPREISDAEIIERERTSPVAEFLRIKVTRTMAKELSQPGSYIFIREKDHPQFFDAPMSVMYSDEVNGTIDLLIQIHGPKTKLIDSPEKGISIRGPYWNGVMGLKNLKLLKNSSCIIAARGIAQSPSVPVAKKLRASQNKVTIILDKGTAHTDYSKKYFEELGCSIFEADLLENKCLTEKACRIISDIIAEDNIKLIFSGGSDILHKGLIQLKDKLNKDILFSCTNNAKICCGEGVCGSCGIRDIDGKSIKPCKAQIDPANIFGGIEK